MGAQPTGARERIEAAVLRGLLALPPAVRRRIAGQPVVRDGLTLDLDTQVLLKLDGLDPRPPVETRTPEQARGDLARSARVVAGRPLPMVSVAPTSVAGMPARLYVPHDETGALLVYFHGGGWVVGDLDTHDAPCRALATASGARVLSVDYRLAPEHPFPAPVDDALAAFRDAVTLAPDPARVAVGGDSAGGHLAAVTAQQAAADGGPAPAFQLLIYPVTDCADVHPSRRTFAEGFFLTKPNMDYYEACFLPPGTDKHDPRVSPLHAADLSGVAPALVVTAGFDPLRDEGEAYAARLAQDGVPVILRRHAGFVHGFANMLGAGQGWRTAVAEMGGVLRAQLSAARSPAASR